MTIFFRNDNDAELLRARPRHLKPPLLFLLLAMSDDDWLFTSDAAVVAAKVPARDDNILYYERARVCVVSVLLQGRRGIFLCVGAGMLRVLLDILPRSRRSLALRLFFSKRRRAYPEEL